MSETGSRSPEDSDRTGSDRRTKRLVAVVVVLVVVVLGGYWLLTQGPGARLVSPAGSTVAEFSGTGNQTTDAFDVREGWQIHWENSGDEFSFAITGDRDFGTVIDQDEPASGITSPVGGGTFRLDITADGAWSVEIVEGD